MTMPIEIPLLANHPICLYVGNDPVTGHVVELSGLALRLAVEGDVAEVPRVRIELEDAAPELTSLQLQGMVTQREFGLVTVTLERLLIAAGQDVVDALLTAWFPAVPRVEECYQQMMRGYGYELRKAIIAGRASPPPQESPSKTETIAGFPGAAVKAALAESAARAEPAPAQHAPEPGAASPPVDAAPQAAAPPPTVEVVPPEPVAPPRPPRGALPPQMLRTAERLLNGTQSALLWIDCSADGAGGPAGYGRAVVYRLADAGRLVFLAARGVQPGFGGKVELIVDLEQGGATHTVRVTASVGWIAPDPDMPGVSLMAVRLTPSNQPQDIRGWFVACQYAVQQVASGGVISAMPSRDLLEGLVQAP